MSDERYARNEPRESMRKYMRALSNLEQPTNTSEVANEAGLSKSSTRDALRELAEDGYIEVRQLDGRVRLYSLPEDSHESEQPEDESEEEQIDSDTDLEKLADHIIDRVLDELAAGDSDALNHLFGDEIDFTSAVEGASDEPTEAVIDQETPEEPTAGVGDEESTEGAGEAERRDGFLRAADIEFLKEGTTEPNMAEEDHLNRIAYDLEAALSDMDLCQSNITEDSQREFLAETIGNAALVAHSPATFLHDLRQILRQKSVHRAKT